VPRPGVPAARAALGGIVVVCFLLLAGCTKPIPAVTIQSGDTTLRSEALQYVLDGKTVGNRKGPKVLSVRAGEVVNISVDRAIAQSGWVVVLDRRPYSPILSNDEHHYSFQAPPLSGTNEVALSIYQQPPNGGVATGLWLFTLREDVAASAGT
jgi:hypothetical protein